MEDRQRGIVEQQERIAGAERNQSALLRKRDEAEAELQRVEPGIGALEAELAKAQATYDETRQAIAAKRIDASAEDGGVEGTLKRGKGPVFRQRQAELEELQRKLAITDEPRLKEAQKQRDRASARIVGLKREIATINGEVAKYRGETMTAEQRIKTAQAADEVADGARLDPARVLPAFERARASFRQQPDTERLGALQAQCGSLLNAMLGTPAAKDKVRSIDCDPKQAARGGGARVCAQCGVGRLPSRAAPAAAKLPQNATTDALLSFGRQCLQDSGLVSKDIGGPGVPPAAHRNEPGRQGAPLRRDLERVPRRQPPGLSGAGAGHRRRRAGVHGRPVRRRGRQIAAVGRAEPQGAQRRAARGDRQERAGRGAAGERRAGAGRHAADARAGRQPRPRST